MTDMTVFRDRSLPPNVKLVYVALIGYADRQRKCWPSRERLAYDTGLSVRAVARAIKAMTEAGLITAVRTQTSNRYTVHDRGGTYIHGSGPGGLTVLPEKTVSPFGRDRESHELDQRSRPETQTTSSGDAYAAAGRFASEPTTRTIITDKKWAAIPDDEIGQAAHYLIKAVYGLMRANGYEIAADARDQMAAVLGECSDKRHAWACAQTWMDNLDQPGANGTTLIARKGRAA